MNANFGYFAIHKHLNGKAYLASFVCFVLCLFYCIGSKDIELKAKTLSILNGLMSYNFL